MQSCFLSTNVNALIACAIALSFSVSAAQDDWGTASSVASPTAQNTVGAAREDVVVDFFEVTNADVRSVFKEISSFSGVDIVLGDGVAGTVTLNVTKKTWKDVLFIVCRILKLTPIIEQGYIYVLPTQQYQQDMITNATASAQTEALSPLKREIIRLNNAMAAEMQASVQPLLSTRGKSTVLQRNNALIIFDTDENITQIKKMLSAVDEETGQILISAKIIEINMGNLQNLGIQWGLFGDVNGTDIQAKHLSTDATAADRSPRSITANSFLSGVLEKISYGIVSPGRLSIALEYLFQDNKAEVVAEPSITTLDNKEARIFMGGQIPILARDVSGNTITTYQEAGTELIVIPHITDGKRVMMELRARKESANSDQSLNTQSARTNVVVNDGETVVIAGLTSNEMQEVEGGVPFLKDIPVLGFLFKKTEKRMSKKNLIIFVTPHIIHKNIEAVTETKATAPQ